MAKFWPHFYQTRSAWSVDQGSNKNHSPAYNFTPTVTKFCVMWEGLSLPHDTKFGNCRCKIVDSRLFPSWSLIHGLRWSGLIKVGPGVVCIHEFIVALVLPYGNTSLNTLRPRQNGHHFPYKIFKRIFFNENVWIAINISLNFIPYGPIDFKSALVQMVAWRWAGLLSDSAKPLSQPMLNYHQTLTAIFTWEHFHKCL